MICAGHEIGNQIFSMHIFGEDDTLSTGGGGEHSYTF